MSTKGGEKLVQSTLQGSEKQIIDAIYNFTEKVDKAEDKSTVSEQFKKILSSIASAPSKVKILAAQTIPKYATNFPQLVPAACTCMTSLCEDEDAQVRSHSLRGLPLMCKGGNADVTAKVTALLLSVLTAVQGQPNEVDIVTRAMDKLVRVDVENVLAALFKHLENESETEEAEAARVAAVKILRTTVAPIAKEILHPNETVEELVKTKIEKYLEICGEEDLVDLVEILTKLKIFGPSGKYGIQGLANILGDQASSEDAGSSDIEVERILVCCKVAVPFFQQGATDDKFTVAIATKVLPCFSVYTTDELRAKILVRLCEIAPHSTEKAATEAVEPVYTLLQTYLAQKSDTPAKDENAKPAEVTFNFLEALLFALHAFGSKTPKKMAEITGLGVSGVEPNQEKSADFRARVVNTHEACTRVSKQLEKVLAKSKRERTVDGKSRAVDVQRGLTSIKNIVGMCRSLLGNPIQFLKDSPNGSFSWSHTAISSSSTVVVGQKRPQSSSGNAAQNKAKKPKPSAQKYVPTRGKK